MSDPAVLRRETYRRVPWPNGGGITDDILLDPGPAPDRRLSLATIARDGPFSDFSGYQRVFVLATGAGVALHPAGAEPVRLDRPGALYAFAGETPMACALPAGEARAFNVFTRRAALRATVAVEAVASGARWAPPLGTQFVFVLVGELGSPAGTVREHDTLALAGACELRALRESLVVRVAFAAASG